MYDFINNSDEWQENNTENDTTIFSTLLINDNSSHLRTYSERILHALCRIEKNTPKGEEPKLYKVLLYNEKNPKQADKIVSSRTRLIEALNDVWYLRRDNILAPIKKMFNFDIPSKSLNDFNLEIWSMNQIDGEDEPFELLFDKEPDNEEGV